MITYVYETLPRAGKKARRYEIRQSIKDAPLKKHPETGEAIRRLIVQNRGLLVREETLPLPETRPAKRAHHDNDHDHHHH